MFGRLRLLNYPDNHKRVYRIYTEMKLNLRRKYKKRLPARVRAPLVQPQGPNMTWSMDFMHDGLINGKSFRSFNLIDDYNREVLTVVLDTSLTSARVIRELEKLIEWRGKPRKIRVDNGPEFVSQVMEDWARSKDIELKFIQKGKPYQNGYIERFNKTYRVEVLDNYAFDNLKQARTMTEAWMWMYNNERPHSALNYLTPRSFIAQRREALALLGAGEDLPTFERDVQNTWESLFLNATS